jgi:hypothetical protein
MAFCSGRQELERNADRYQVFCCGWLPSTAKNYKYFPKKFDNVIAAD